MTAQWQIAELDSLNTLPKYQGQGLGSMIMEWGVEKGEALGVPSIILSTDVAYGFYLKYGYREVERRVVDMGQWGGSGLYKNVFLVREGCGR